MSYRIDGETPYWGGLQKTCGKRLSDPIKPASEETVESVIKAFESFSKEVKKETELLLRMDSTSRDIKKTLETLEKLEQIAMEEKKTNKMTRAEAFEWLKNKKIRCIDGSGNHFLTIMSILENIGFRWSGTNRYEDYQVFCLFTSHNGRVTYLDIANAHAFNDEREEEVLMEDILSLEIEEEYNYSPFEVGYTNEPCPEIVAVQELLRNSKNLKDKTLVITKDNVCIL